MPFGRRVRHGKPFSSQARITRVSPQPIYGDIAHDAYGHDFGDTVQPLAVLTMTDQPIWDPDIHTAAEQLINSWDNTHINFDSTDVHNFTAEAWLYVLKNDGLSRSDGFRVTIGEI